MYPTSKPSEGGPFYVAAPVIAGVTCGIAIVLLLYRHVWNYAIVAAESVAFLVWTVLLGLNPKYPLERNQGMATFAVGSGFVLWAETVFVVVVAPLAYGLYRRVLKQHVSGRSTSYLAGGLWLTAMGTLEGGQAEWERAKHRRA